MFMKKWLAICGLILVTVIWGGGFVASDMALESMKPFQIMTIRFLLASVLMGLISFRSLKGMTRKEVRAGVLMGMALFAAFALQIIGLQYTTPSKNAFLTALNVVIVPFISFYIPPGICGALDAGSLIIATPASVVMNKAEILAAFNKALRVTFVGSIIPLSNISTHSPDLASNP